MRILILAIALSSISISWLGAAGRTTAAEEPIILWPNGAPGAVGKEPIDIPTLTPYLAPKEKATGAAVIVCPGGGYSHLADHEGRPVAEWLNTLGITAFVLKVSAWTSIPSSGATARCGARDSYCARTGR